MDKEEYMYGRKIMDVNSIYKGDGVTTCKWCGDTGMMHTFSNDGHFYNDAPCWCKVGMELVCKEQGHK